LLLVIGFIVFFGGMAILGGALVAWVDSDIIFPRVRVMDVELGGQHTAEATKLLEAAWRQPSIRLESADEHWWVSPEDLGMHLDSQATVYAAYKQGRSISSIETMVRSGSPPALQPSWSYDYAVSESYLRALAEEIDVPTVDAGLIIANGLATATPARDGQSLDVDSALAQISENPALIRSGGFLSLAVNSVQPEVSDTSALAESINELLSTTITIRIYDPVTGESSERTPEAAILSEWLSINPTDAAAGEFEWFLDDAKLEEYLAPNVASFGAGRYLNLVEASELVTDAIDNQTAQVLVRVYHHDRQHEVQAGETLASIGRAYGVPYPWIQQANPNLEDGLFAGQPVTIPSPDALLPLPIVTEKRIVVSITQQRVWVYENGELKWDWLASTGIDESPTAPGIFQIQSHEPHAYAGNWDLCMPNFLGVYHPVPNANFMNGFHGFPTRSGSNLLWTGDLGHKVTYGCILVSSENAATLYEWADDGVIVEIQS
jgi:lipoprotein-anchoring transpeptidase ErfK/SrfK